GWNVVLELVDHDGVSDRIEYYWGKDISGSLQGAGGVGGLLYLKRNGTIFVPIYDAYGNVMEYRAADGSLAASYVYDAFGCTASQNGPLADAFRFRYSTKCFDAATGLYYYGKRFYSPALRRWFNRDPIEEDGGVNVYAFCRNNGVVYYDKNGNAYFAVRGLGKVLPPLKWSHLFSCPFMKAAVDIAANMANVELVHEQIFFEDDKQPSSRGWSADGYLDNESSERYQKRDGGYDDCIMRIAMSLVDPSHYQLTWIGNRAKCNCQDYADALRRKYREIKDDPEVKCKCK
ncbi:MAG: RHS repeat-associated core domain-containing protein, partial [Paludibacteraceae bacterium]|nr:RHS repeat-associated core domain-containing protein [Paludibacteraceae bacterium]